MSLSYLRTWILMILLVAGVVLEWVTFGNPFGSIFEALPSDLGLKEALRRCDHLGRHFQRFFESDREMCYRTMLPAADSTK